MPNVNVSFIVILNGDMVSFIMMSVFMMSVIMLNVVLLNVHMLNVIVLINAVMQCHYA
jgi:hypothetical protein